jgi:hypothetical protein
MGGRGRAYQAEPVTPTPKKEDPAVLEATAEAVRRRQRAQGYRSTVLSRNMVDQSDPQLKAYFGS